jgi:hypothetical protein
VNQTEIERTAMVASTAAILEAVEQWCRALNVRAEQKYGAKIADDIYRQTDRLRLGLREALQTFEEMGST